VDKKSDELATAEEKLANDKEDREDTQKSKTMDETFFADLRVKCKKADTEFANRQATRTAEIGAVSQALNFLNSDDAHDLFSSTFNKKDNAAGAAATTAFVQTSTSSNEARRVHASSLLASAAAKSSEAHRPR
jgi:hypothetical protein